YAVELSEPFFLSTFPRPPSPVAEARADGRRRPRGVAAVGGRADEVARPVAGAADPGQQLAHAAGLPAVTAGGRGRRPACFSPRPPVPAMTVLDPTPVNHHPSAARLLGEIVDDAGRLAGQQADLFRAEVHDAAGKVSTSAKLLGVGAALAAYGGLCLAVF